MRRNSSGGLRDGVAHAIVPMHRSDGGVWRVLPLGAHVLLVCRRSFRTRMRDSRVSSVESRGRLVIGTVAGSVVYSDRILRIRLHSDRHYHLALERSTRLHTPEVNLNQKDKKRQPCMGLAVGTLSSDLLRFQHLG